MTVPPCYGTQIKAIISSKELPEIIEWFKVNATVHRVLSCPIGRTYLLKFAREEFNDENVLCLYEVESVHDLVKRDLQSVADVESKSILKKCAKLLHLYLESGADKEVNIDGNTKKIVLGAIKSYQESFKKEKHTTGRLNTLESFSSSLESFQSQLIINISDTFQRFITSELYKEMLISAFNLDDPANELKVETYNTNVEKLKKCNEGTVLNQGVEYEDDISVRHPLTIITEALEKTLAIVRRDNSILTFNAPTRTLDFNYEAVVPHSELWNRVKQQCCELTKSDIMAMLLTREEKLAFFINLYNMLFIHGLLVHSGAPNSCLTSQLFYRGCKYNVFGMDFSLESILDGVFGENKHHWLFGKSFNKSDPRVVFSLNLSEEEKKLVHFGLANFKTDSARVEVVHPYSVFKQLEEMRKEYLSTHVTIDNDKNKVGIPMYLKDLVVAVAPRKGSLTSLRRTPNVVLTGEFALKEMEKLGLLSTTETEKLQDSEYSFEFIQDTEQSTNIQCLFERSKSEELIILLQRAKRLAKKKQSRADALARIKITKNDTVEPTLTERQDRHSIRFVKTHMCAFQ